MSNLQSLVASQASQFAALLADQVREAVLADLRHMTINQLIAISKGDSSAAAVAAAPAAGSAAPAKRGPGRPKKAATAAAPAPKTAKKKSGGRLARRSADDIQATLTNVVALLHANSDGLRAEQVRDVLKLDKKELPRVIIEGLSTGVISKTGEKRATTYFAKGGKKKG